MTLTEWYPISIKPVREGIYLFRTQIGSEYSYCIEEYTRRWDFEFYGFGKTEWCGLTKEALE